MQEIILAFMILFSPTTAPDHLRLYAELLQRASPDVDTLAELFVHGRFEGRWGSVGVPMGVTAWARSHRRAPNEHEAVCAARETIRDSVRVCGGGARNRARRAGYYLTGRCVETAEASRRARSANSMRRIFHTMSQHVETVHTGELQCQSGE